MSLHALTPFLSARFITSGLPAVYEFLTTGTKWLRATRASQQLGQTRIFPALRNDGADVSSVGYQVTAGMTSVFGRHISVTFPKKSLRPFTSASTVDGRSTF
jgi:hypothetical protein